MQPQLWVHVCGCAKCEWLQIVCVCELLFSSFLCVYGTGVRTEEESQLNARPFTKSRAPNHLCLCIFGNREKRGLRVLRRHDKTSTSGQRADADALRPSDGRSADRAARGTSQRQTARHVSLQ